MFYTIVLPGAVINTEDLVEALDSGTLGGAALDCTDPEPLPQNHPLTNMDNVILTHHMAWTQHAVRHSCNSQL